MPGKIFRSFVLFILIVLPASAARAAALDTTLWQGRSVVAGRVLITLAPDAAPARLVSQLAAHGFTASLVAGRDGVSQAADEWAAHVTRAGAERFVLVKFAPDRPLDDALAALTALDGVDGAFPDQMLHEFWVPNDPMYGDDQQNLRQIDLELAWDRSFGAGVIVAVVDTGYVTSGLLDGVVHLLPGYDFPDETTNVYDEEGHGTLVSNTIAGATNNGIGTAAVAGEAEILPCKVFANGSDGAAESDILRAIDWAVTQGARVVNMSLGGGGYDDVSNTTMHDAVEANVVLVAASGNDGTDQVSYPAAYPDVIAVGSCGIHALGDLPVRSSFSNYGPQLSVVAPGENIIGETDFGGKIGYYAASGTSLSSPHVAGTAALLIALVDGKYTVAGIRQAIEQSANRPPGSGKSNELGWGEVDADAAMTALAGAVVEPPPTCSILANPTGGAAPLRVEFTAGATDSAGQVTTYIWSFSTGETFNVPSFTYTFDQPGQYTVLLSVTDSNGNGASDQTTITVGPGSSSGGKARSAAGCGAAPAAGPLEALITLAPLAGLWLARRRRSWQ